MKTLVVYYSLDGSTRVIAQSIAEETGADILELRYVNPIRVQGFLKYLWAGKQVALKQKPKLLPFDKNPEDYNILFLGTPVWAANYAPAFNTFCSSVDLKGRKIALFCCSGGIRGKTFENMEKALAGSEVIGKREFVSSSSSAGEANAQSAREWARELKEMMG